jgi:hypothetical protein
MAVSDRRAEFRVANFAFVRQLVGRELRHDRDDATRCLDFEILATLKTNPSQGGRGNNNWWFIFHSLFSEAAHFVPSNIVASSQAA